MNTYTLTEQENKIVQGFRDQLQEQTKTIEQATANKIAIQGALDGVFHMIAAQQAMITGSGKATISMDADAKVLTVTPSD